MQSGKSCVAEVVKTFGVNGELVLKLYNSFPEEIDLEEPVFIDIDGIPVPFFFKSFRFNGKSKAIVVFDDLESESLAEELVGKKVDIDETLLEDTQALPSPSDFIGYKVYLDGNSPKYLGTIKDFFDYPNNPLFQLINAADEELLLPIHEDYIASIDDVNKTIAVILPEGFLEIFG